ncbi:hypothetical protein [Ferrimicrobium sp.]|uniref:hypothetical protein n=1 Tax=Ferrimicrobium sp. TaxID=2926050 RepID=UPI002613BAA4|nr:hypothetical protein [Ferrimicrobium sp.]
MEQPVVFENLEHKSDGGFIDLVTLLFVSVIVLLILIPFLIGMIRIVGLKQQLDQRAWNLLRTATIEGTLPPPTIYVQDELVDVTLQGTLQGCSTDKLILSTNLTLPGLALLGRSIATYRVIGSAMIATGAYRSPDNVGFNCAPFSQ